MKVTLVSLLGYLFLFTGLITLKPNLLLLSIPFFLYLAFGYAFSPEDLQIAAKTKTSNNRVITGEVVQVDVKLTNHGATIEELQLQDGLPTGLIPVKGRLNRSLRLAAGESISLKYSVRCGRGLHYFPGVKITALDPFGLFTVAEVLKDERWILSVPETPKVKRIELPTHRTLAYAGTKAARKGGAGIEFFNVRPYAFGDPLRWINWKASARRPESFYVNEFQQERVIDLGIIVDARTRTNRLPGGKSIFEYSLQAAAGVSDTFISQGDRVGLLIYGSHLDWTFPGYGKVQQERILRALAMAVEGESEIFSQMENLPTKFFPPKSNLVLISPLHYEDIGVLIQIRSRGYELLVISPEWIPLAIQTMSDGASTRLAGRILHLERELIIRKLNQGGIQVIPWDTHMSFQQVMKSRMSRPTSWYRSIGLRG